MGGFRVDGCGTKDYFTKMKYLGEQMCPRCKSMTPFYLERAKYKISVFYIPTVTLKERYAIMCDKCKTGNFIEETEMHMIMSEQNTAISSTSRVIQEAPEKICPKCGAKGGGLFCEMCGTRYDEKKVTDTVGEWECGLCGTMNSIDAVNCSLCGCVRQGGEK